MRALLHRVREASAQVHGAEIAHIGAGLLDFLGVEEGEDAAACDRPGTFLLESGCGAGDALGDTH